MRRAARDTPDPGGDPGSGYVLRREQIIPAPIDAVFRYFEDPRNLAGITPSWLRFEIVRFSDERVREGSVVEYHIRWLGVRLRWVSRITRWDPPRAFVDEMERGPYGSWHHTHSFEPAEGGVRMTDVIAYEMPAGPLGRLVHALFVRRQLEEIFDYRARRVAERFPTDPSGVPSDRGSVK